MYDDDADSEMVYGYIPSEVGDAVEDDMDYRTDGDASDYGADDYVSAQTEDMANNWATNRKRTYDSYQQRDLDELSRDRAHFDSGEHGNRSHFDAAAHANRAHADAALVTSQNHVANVNNVALQALQNAVETANMVSKQAVRHSDFAVDRQWNLEPSEAAAQSDVLPSATLEAIRAAVADAVVAALSKPAH